MDAIDPLYEPWGTTPGAPHDIWDENAKPSPSVEERLDAVEKRLAKMDEMFKRLERLEHHNPGMWPLSKP